MKQNIFLFLIFLSFGLKSQEITLLGGSRDFYSLDIETCEYTFLFSAFQNFTDISYSPDGRLFGVDRNGNIFEVNQTTGSSILRFTLIGDVHNSMTISSRNIIYVADGNGDLYSIDLNTGIERYHGNFGYGASGDLTFYRGDLYVATSGDRIIKINIENPSLSTVIIDANLTGSIFGIVSYAKNCEEVEVYAITNGFSTFYLIDFENQELIELCQIDFSVFGGASTSEFLSSNPVFVDDIFQQDPSSCNNTDGSITLIATGGIGTLSYSIDSTNFQTNPTFNNLGPGLYRVFVQDENGCILKREVQLANIESPDLNLVSTKPATCGINNAMVVLEGSNGMPPYTYSIDGINFQSNPVFENLNDGDYTFYILDALACSNSIPFSINRIPKFLIADPIIKGESCAENDGSIEIFVTGGNSPYQFSMDNTDFQTNAIFSNLTAGPYNIYVTDADNCSNQLMVDIPFSSGPSVSIQEITPTSCGFMNGSIQILTTSGAAPYRYSIDGNTFQENALFENLSPNSYNILVVDANLCEAIIEFEIAASSPLQFDTIISQIPNCNENNGTFIFNISGNSGLITSFINETSNNNSLAFNNLPVGTFRFNFIDESNCQIDTIMELDQLACDVFIPNVFSPNGDNINDQFKLYSNDEDLIITRFIIYDRWGNQIHSKNNSIISDNNYWWSGKHASGKNHPSAVYVYFAEVDDGTKVTIYKGDVTLIR